MNGFQEQRTQNCAHPVKVGSGKRVRKRVNQMPPTQEIVKTIFDYHEDGYLVWKFCKGRPDRVGLRAGTLGSNGYWVVKIAHYTYPLHRIIFLYHHGYLPETDVDHEDRNPRNNKIENLREVSRSCNKRNCGGKSYGSRVWGVTKHTYSRGWVVRIKVKPGTERLYLGYYQDFTEAVKARHDAEVKYNWKGCNSTSSAYLYLKEKGIIK